MRNKLYKIFAAGIALALAFTLSCSSGSDDPSDGGGTGGGNVVYGTPVAYDGETYKTIVIGTQTWMAKNLNYNATGSKCYGEGDNVIVNWDNDGNPIYKTLSNVEIQANCQKYGRLYDWNTAMKACPEGWHLPSYAEWDALMTTVGGEETAGTMLKTTNDWAGYGEDAFGFSALPGGYGSSDGNFNFFGKGGFWWSGTEYDASSAYSRRIYLNRGDASRGPNDKTNLYSVRCVKD